MSLYGIIKIPLESLNKTRLIRFNNRQLIEYNRRKRFYGRTAGGPQIDTTFQSNYPGTNWDSGRHVPIVERFQS